MVKNIIYTNLIFLSILSVYFFAQNFDSQLFDSFYLLFSLFCIACSSVLLFSELNYKDSEERGVYHLLFIGLLSFGFGNLLWFINDEFLYGSIPVNFINILFLFQLLSKHSFFRFLEKGMVHSNLTSRLIRFCSLIVMLTLFAEIYSISSFFTSFLNIFFILESVITILYLTQNLVKLNHFLIDLRFFIAGTVVWLFADVTYLINIDFNKYTMGNLVDFMYFLGFYLIVSSIIYKSFNIDRLINYVFEKKLFYI